MQKNETDCPISLLYNAKIMIFCISFYVFFYIIRQFLMQTFAPLKQDFYPTYLYALLDFSLLLHYNTSYHSYYLLLEIWFY